MLKNWRYNCAKNSDDLEQALKEHERIRLPVTEKVVPANWGQGPDQIMQVVEERRPDDFRDVRNIMTPDEVSE